MIGGDQEVSDDVAKKGSVGDDKQQSLSRDKRQGLEVKREEYEDEEEEETAEEEDYEENADNSQMIDEGEGEDDEEYDEEEEEEEEEEEGGNGSEDDGQSPAGGSTRAGTSYKKRGSYLSIISSLVRYILKNVSMFLYSMLR